MMVLAVVLDLILWAGLLLSSLNISSSYDIKFGQFSEQRWTLVALSGCISASSDNCCTIDLLSGLLLEDGH